MSDEKKLDQTKTKSRDHKELDYSQPIPIREGVIEITPSVPAEAAKRPVAPIPAEGSGDQKGSG